MKALTGWVLPASLGPAWAGALQDCAGDVHLVPCLERAKEVATEQMLERFLQVREAPAALGGRRADQAADALRQSQRAFERYVVEHCQGLGPILADGGARGLPCETDLLRQRTTTLEAIDLGTARL